MALADVLADLARTHQVIVVTHLAQVAVRGEAHYVVRKAAGDERAMPETDLRPPARRRASRRDRAHAVRRRHRDIARPRPRDAGTSGRIADVYLRRPANRGSVPDLPSATLSRLAKIMNRGLSNRGREKKSVWKRERLRRGKRPCKALSWCLALVLCAQMLGTSAMQAFADEVVDTAVLQSESLGQDLVYDDVYGVKTTGMALMVKRGSVDGRIGRCVDEGVTQRTDTVNSSGTVLASFGIRAMCPLRKPTKHTASKLPWRACSELRDGRVLV